MSTIGERVAAGMALLDERVPGWEPKIDLETLDLQSTCLCVLGQLFGKYGAAVEALIADGVPLWEEISPGDLGFTNTDHALSYPRLTTAWKRAIRARLADQAQATGSEGR